MIVRSFTPKHGAQQNDLTSDDSASLTVTPTAQQSATITIALDTQPDSKTNFSFGGGLGSFILDDITPQDGDTYGNSKTFSVPAGTYAITESVPSGWFLTGIGCNPSTTTSTNLAAHQLTITATSGANITCTFTTQRAGTIVAGAYNDHNRNHKQYRGDEWLGGWVMQLRAEGSSLVANQATNQQGRATFSNLLPGNYTVCETLQTGWFNITPGSNSSCYTVTVAPGTAVWTRFGNSTTVLMSLTSLERASDVSDVIVCDLVSIDDLGNPTTEEYDPWEAEEDAAAKLMIFLPVVRRYEFGIDVFSTIAGYDVNIVKTEYYTRRIHYGAPEPNSGICPTRCSSTPSLQHDQAVGVGIDRGRRFVGCVEWCCVRRHSWDRWSYQGLLRQVERTPEGDRRRSRQTMQKQGTGAELESNWTARISWPTGTARGAWSQRVSNSGWRN